MRAAYRAGNRDRNEKHIRRILDALGVRYTRMPPGAGFDLLVWISPMEAWEIKNPAQAASDRQLTQAEQDARDYCRQWSIPYRVIQTEQDAIDNLKFVA